MKEKIGVSGQNTWYLHFEEPQQVLCKALLASNLLPGAICHKEYKILGFYAKNVVSLREKHVRGGGGGGGGGEMNYSDFLRLSECIGIQLFHLEKLGWTFYGLLLDDILVVDGHVYIYVGENHLKQIFRDGDEGFGGGVKGGVIRFTAPFPKGLRGSLFLSPEIMEISALPSSVDYRCVYCSLGKLLLYLIKGGDGDGVLESIHDTKLYWFIQRCLRDKILLLI
jgi:hypothetical protein